MQLSIRSPIEAVRGTGTRKACTMKHGSAEGTYIDQRSLAQVHVVADHWHRYCRSCAVPGCHLSGDFAFLPIVKKKSESDRTLLYMKGWLFRMWCGSILAQALLLASDPFCNLSTPWKGCCGQCTTLDLA